MSDRPKIYAIRPHELREQAMKWLAEVDDHLTSEEPMEGYKPGGIRAAK